LESALIEYKKAKSLGIEKADQNIRNVSAKLLGKFREEAARSKNEEK
jgi:hypothetical protein